jgi:hypothetical protein
LASLAKQRARLDVVISRRRFGEGVATCIDQARARDDGQGGATQVLVFDISLYCHIDGRHRIGAGGAKHARQMRLARHEDGRVARLLALTGSRDAHRPQAIPGLAGELGLILLTRHAGAAHPRADLRIDVHLHDALGGSDRNDGGTRTHRGHGIEALLRTRPAVVQGIGVPGDALGIRRPDGAIARVVVGTERIGPQQDGTCGPLFLVELAELLLAQVEMHQRGHHRPKGRSEHHVLGGTGRRHDEGAVALQRHLRTHLVAGGLRQPMDGMRRQQLRAPHHHRRIARVSRIAIDRQRNGTEAFGSESIALAEVFGGAPVVPCNYILSIEQHDSFFTDSAMGTESFPGGRSRAGRIPGVSLERARPEPSDSSPWR